MYRNCVIHHRFPNLRGFTLKSRTDGRKKILFEPELMYHLWTHANGSENLFREEENYGYFMEKYAYHVHPVVDTFAYCLMPNHLHLMVRPRTKNEVLEFIRRKKEAPTLQGLRTLGGFSNIMSKQYSDLFNGYTQAYNRKYDRKGSLFIPNFKRKLVDSNRYFSHLIAYIHNNPVHHGFVKRAEDWLHSSYHAYLFNKRTRINKEAGMAWFGSRESFKEVHQQVNMEKLISLFEE